MGFNILGGLAQFVKNHLPEARDDTEHIRATGVQFVSTVSYSKDATGGQPVYTREVARAPELPQAAYQPGNEGWIALHSESHLYTPTTPEQHREIPPAIYTRETAYTQDTYYYRNNRGYLETYNTRNPGVTDAMNPNTWGAPPRWPEPTGERYQPSNEPVIDFIGSIFGLIANGPSNDYDSRDGCHCGDPRCTR